MCDELDEGLAQLLGELQPRADDVRQREEREEQADPEDLQSKDNFDLYRVTILDGKNLSLT